MKTYEDIKRVVNEILHIIYDDVQLKIDNFWREYILIGTFEYVVADVKRIINNEKNQPDINMRNVFCGRVHHVFDIDRLYDDLLKSGKFGGFVLPRRHVGDRHLTSDEKYDVIDYVNNELYQNKDIDHILDYVNYEKLAETLIGDYNIHGRDVYYVSLPEFKDITPTFYFIGRSMNRDYEESNGGSLLSSGDRNEADWYE